MYACRTVSDCSLPKKWFYNIYFSHSELQSTFVPGYTLKILRKYRVLLITRQGHVGALCGQGTINCLDIHIAHCPHVNLP